MCVAAEAAWHVVSDQVQRSKETKVSAAEQVVSDQRSGVRNQRLVRQSQWSEIGRGIGVWGTIRTVQKEYRKM